MFVEFVQKGEKLLPLLTLIYPCDILYTPSGELRDSPSGSVLITDWAFCPYVIDLPVRQDNPLFFEEALALLLALSLTLV